MLEFIREQASTLVLCIALSALVLAFLVLRARRKRTRLRLKKDPSGLWKYHSDTKFTRKEAYRPRVAPERSASVRKRSDPDASSGEKPLAVLTFRGDIRARQHESFARLVDEVVLNKDGLSEVVVRISSPGGLVSQYGHVLAEMERIRTAGLPLTVCVDVVAASGGYLASLPATKILAAPFAVVGSVGVVAFIPNIRELLTKHRIQPRTFTAGKYKRTVTLTDEATAEEIERFQGQLDSVHVQFRDLLVRYRPQAKIAEVETGDHWTAKESIDLGLGLVDGLMTSSDYLLAQNRDRDLVEIAVKRSMVEDGIGRLFSLVQETFRRAA